MMNERILFIKNYFTSKSDRSKIIIINVFNSFLLKGASMVISLIQVPITIKCLNNEQYGVWMTLFSIVTWFNMFDLGLGNGFRNKFTQAIALENWEEAKRYNSALHISITLITGCLVCVFLLAQPYLDWYRMLNVSVLKINNLNKIALVVILLFFLQFILKNITTVLLAYHKTALSNVINVVNSFICLVLVYMLTVSGKANLFNIAVVFMLSPVIIYLIFSIYLYSGLLSKFKPSLMYFNWGHIKEISGVGIQFFIIQLAVLIMYMSGNILISQLFSPSEVTPYNISNRLFTSTQFFFTILMTPFWSAFTEAYVKKDNLWIKKAINNIILVWVGYSILLSILLLFSTYIYSFWIGETIKIDFNLSIQMFIYSVLINWTSIFSYFVNSISKIRLQMILAIFQAVINIPLTIYLVRYLHLGPWGIILSVNLLLLITAIILPIQYLKILNNRDYGIWGK